MVPPSSPGLGLGSTPNPVLSQENFPTLQQTSSKNKRQRPDSDDETEASTTFKSTDNFPKFLVIKSEEEKPITSLSPFIIEKQIESFIGTPKTVKKLKNKTLLVETTRRAQTENLLKVTKFFNMKVLVSELRTLNTSKGIIKDRTLKGETEQDICEYLKSQGVIAVKRFTIKKDHEGIETNTLLLTFKSITVPKTLRIFYQFVPVDIYVPNPLRCFNCQRFGHHESDCPIDYCSVCEKCGTGGFEHLASACPNRGLNHLSRSNVCEVWKKEKEIMKIKVTRNLTYLEARKIVEHTPETTFSTIVQSAIAKPEIKNDYTQTSENDKIISSSTKVLIPTKYKTNKSQPSSKASTPQSKQPSTSQVEPAKKQEITVKKWNKPKKEKPISKEKSKR